MSLRVTFLGTGGAVPTTERNPSAIMVNREGDRLLFDVGEGTQRQMMRHGTGFTVSDIFLTHLHGDHVLGLPGLLQTWDFNDREAALTVHAPRGTERKVRELAGVVDTDPGYPFSVEPVAPGEIALAGDGYEVRAFDVDHRGTAVGYALVEDDRKGRFDRAHAEELGVPVGPKFGRLHEGEPVELEDGTVVRPEQVVGDPRPGRRVVYTGDTRPTERVVDVAAGADLLVHDATFTEALAERAAETGHATAREAGRVAARADVARLALTHVSSRYAGDPSPLAREARESFHGEAFVARDGMELDVPFPDAGD